jgi:hypothetical protein
VKFEMVLRMGFSDFLGELGELKIFEV